jgi:hypothetical protein
MFCCFKFLCFFCLVEPFIVQVVGWTSMLLMSLIVQ